jgi:predicted amidophosphoribosyltransferase
LVAAPSLPAPEGLDSCRALLSYEGAGRELVARLKYRNARGALSRLAASLASLVDDIEVDALTWAPTSGARRRERGFDQAELLARSVAVQVGVGCLPLLRRVAGGPQTGRRVGERREGPRFVAIRRVPPIVLLVDDVCTTGATLAAAATALKRAGASRVVGLVVARTPSRVPMARREPGRSDGVSPNTLR